MKKILAVLLSITAVIGAMAAPLTTEAAAKSYTSLGADLDTEQRAEVLRLLGLTEESLQAGTVVTVTNEEEHQYLDAYLPQDVIGTHALSSCTVKEEGSGHGITVETHNINYVTPAMYENALATAGMKNATVVVAGPFGISGTAALVGAMKAYAAMKGAVIDPIYLDGATDELVTTGALGENLGSAEKAAQFVAAIKQVIINSHITSRTDILNIINELAPQFDITLTDEDREMIASLMEKLAQLNIDPATLTEQARGVYEQLKTQGIDLSKYGLSDENVNTIIGWLSKIFTRLLNWFKSLAA